jgi:hypothetical protein
MSDDFTWRCWGQYAKFTVCTCCNEFRYCRHKPRWPWLCADCFNGLGMP